MKHTQKSIAALLLCTILLSSCGGTTTETNPADTTETTTAETVPAETERAQYIPKNTDYNGYTFRIFNFDEVGVNGWAGIPDDIDVAELTGDALNDAVFNRNQTVEETLNITIEGSVHKEDVASEIEQAVMGGSDELDAAFPALRFIANLYSKDLLHDLRTLPMDFTSPWWDKNAVDCYTFQEKMYGVVGDLSYNDLMSTYVSYFNKDMATEYQLEDFYSLVLEGKWTFDKMVEMGEVVGADLDGNNVYDGSDKYGISCQNDATYIFLHAGGIRITERDENGQAVFALDNERGVDALQKIYTLMQDPARFFNRQTFNYTLVDAINMFIEERALILIRPIQTLFMLRDMNANFGIIPIPKLEESQNSYGSAVNHYSGTFLCIPTCVTDTDRAADILQFMAAESHYTIKEPLYDTILGNKLLRDDNSAEMLDITFASRVFDVGLFFNFGNFSETMLKNKDTNVASMLAETEKAVDTAIAEFNASLAE